MKTLYLVRHAKSSWDDHSITDFERPLNKRGHRDAPFMGRLMREQGVKPDIIIASPANRALTTARLMADEMDYPFEEIRTNESLYESGMPDYLQTIASLNDVFSSAMIIGHNPTLTTVSEYLSDARIGNMPTGGIVTIEFDNQSWADIIKRNGVCKGMEFPKKYFA